MSACRVILVAVAMHFFVSQSGAFQTFLQADSNTIALWSFDSVGNDTVRDLSGNGNHAILKGAQGSEIAGHYGDALLTNWFFNYAIVDNVKMPSSISGIVIESLFYPYELPTGLGTGQCLIGLLPAGYYQMIDYQTGSSYVMASTTQGEDGLLINYMPYYQKWNYVKIILVKDSIYTYMNYAFCGAKKLNGNIKMAIDTILIGARSVHDSLDFFYGALDEMRISRLTPQSHENPLPPLSLSRGTYSNMLNYAYPNYGVQSPDGGHLVCGKTYNNLFLAKIDRQGIAIFEKQLTDVQEEEAYCIEQMSNGGYLIVGRCKQNAGWSNDWYMVGTNGIGDTLWRKILASNGDDEAFRILKMDTGTFLVCGTFNNRIAWMKTDERGDSLWMKTMPDTGSVFWAQKRDTNTFLLLASRPKGTSFITIDKNGEILSTATFTPAFTNMQSMVGVPSGGFIASGYGNATQGAWIARLDETGSQIWRKTYITGASISAALVCPTADNGFVLGMTTSAYPDTRYNKTVIIKTDGNGDSLWQRVIPNLFAGTYLKYLYQMTNGGYALGGYSIYTSPMQSSRAYMTFYMTDNSGNFNNWIWCARPVTPTILPSDSVRYHGSVVVTISYPDGTAKIHFTTDASQPDSNSPIYSAPFAITQSTIVRAIAIQSQNVFSQISVSKFNLDSSTPTRMARENFRSAVFTLGVDRRGFLLTLQLPLNSAYKDVRGGLFNLSGRCVFKFNCALENNGFSERFSKKIPFTNGYRPVTGTYLARVQVGTLSFEKRVMVCY
jgi:hypothetical protein